MCTFISISHINNSDLNEGNININHSTGDISQFEVLLK